MDKTGSMFSGSLERQRKPCGCCINSPHQGSEISKEGQAVMSSLRLKQSGSGTLNHLPGRAVGAARDWGWDQHLLDSGWASYHVKARSCPERWATPQGKTQGCLFPPALPRSPSSEVVALMVHVCLEEREAVMGCLDVIIYFKVCGKVYHELFSPPSFNIPQLTT